MVAPAQLALVTIFQFAEGLSDRQAADAVRGRIDWKYALCLELEHPGFDASVLSEFRTRLIAAGAETVLFETLLTTLKEAGLVKPRGRQRTDSTHVLAAIQVLNWLELVGETLRHALNTLAVVAPDWLRSQVPADWYPRYSRRFEEYRLPDALTARTALAEQIGADGRALLAMVFASETDAWLRQVPAVETLRRVWVQQFSAEEPRPLAGGADLPPSAVVISSPYDLEARYCKKRETIWTGYKAHLTETCDDDLPNIVTDVDTTTATTVDHAVTAAVQVRLARQAWYRASSWWTPATSPPTTWSPARRTTSAPCSARSTRTTAGKRGRARASVPPTSRSSGSRSVRSARKVVSAGSGSRHTTAPATTSSTSASITRTVAIVRSASSACPPTASAPSPSARSRCMKPSDAARGGVSTHRSSASSTRPARSKGPLAGRIHRRPAPHALSRPREDPTPAPAHRRRTQFPPRGDVAR